MAAIKELTAKGDRCAIGTCPAVFGGTESDKNKLVIIGARVTQQEIAAKVGQGEVALEIDRGLVTRALAGPVSRLLMRAGL